MGLFKSLDTYHKSKTIQLKKEAIYKQEKINLIFLMANADGGVPNGQDTVQFFLDCKEKGQNLSNQLPPSIFMVPSSLRLLSPSSFEPRVVSIGPLHRKNKNLQAFEAQKAVYLHYLLDRFSSPMEQILHACLQKVNASIDIIRECYVGLETYTDVELVKMMVMDGCFMLQFLSESGKHSPLVSSTYAIITNSICLDLVLLENQIPFFVLQDIFDCTLNNIQATSLSSMILDALEFLNPFIDIKNDAVGTSHDHILDLMQKTFHPKNIMPERNSSYECAFHSALELHKAGVKFKPKKGGDWQMAMEFSSSRFASFCWCWGKPTLGMPVLHIQDSTEKILRNLIAYEQCNSNARNYVTSYALAIDDLVNTTEDLLKLVESKVIINNLGSNEDATKMINNIGNEVIIKEFCYTEQWQQLDGHYNAYWPKNIAWLKRTYFNSPWNIIALLAGLVIFVLTAIQTIFTIKAA